MKLLRWTVAVAAFALANAVDRSKFRTCAQSGFCSRNRDAARDSPFAVVNGALNARDDGMAVFGEIATAGVGALSLEISAYEDGILRVRITEPSQPDVPPRYEPPDVLVEDVESRRTKVSIESDDTSSTIIKSLAGNIVARVTKSPFRIDVLDIKGERTLVTINKDGKLHFEQRSVATKAPENSGVLENVGGESKTSPGDSERKIVDWGEDGKPIYEDGQEGGEESSGNEVGAVLTEEIAPTTEAPESFGGHTDHKPSGPMSVGIDVTFPDTTHVYGIPEHAAPFSLKTTRGGTNAFNEPYRMYNLDVFEYELDEPMALYGHIPVVMGHNSKSTSMVFWNNPSETFVDVTDGSSEKQVHWISESGVVDVMVMVGPDPSSVSKQYASMTGTTPTPPMFALAYHQCRWNYRDEKDVREVNDNFEKYDFPYDVIWLDIEHTDGKRYFTWDKNKFPTPEEMQKNIAHYGRKMVTIVDPHIKRDFNYYIHKEATEKGLYIKDKDDKNKDFQGWCWPGDSSYLDFTNANVRSWWADQFAFDKYIGSTENLFTWNDMNEPSVFNGPEVSMHKQSLSLDHVEHREWHNLYGFYQHMATAEGLIRRFEKPLGSAAKRTDPRVKRPFVLSRSFFAGSQRHGAIWTGDNLAAWSHLKIASDMLLSMNIAGLPFIGADVGGFFKNPDEELLQRWYQAGAFQPFFRAHAHIDTKRREPWLFGEEVMKRIAKAVKTRYSLLPFWYTLFHQHEVTGLPVMRPLWYLAPSDEKTFGLGDQWLLGDDLLVKPVTDPGVSSLEVYLPNGFSWYQFDAPHAYQKGGQFITEHVPLDKITVYQRAGSIIPRKMRVRRSSLLMRNDPYTLFVAIDQDTNSAAGALYVDDESSFAYKSGASCSITFSFKSNVMQGDSECGAFTADKPQMRVERIVLLGHSGQITTAKLETLGVPLSFQFDSASGALVLRKPVHSFIPIPFKIQLE